jgi:hypothetical protein
MFREIKRAELALKNEDAAELLKDSSYGVLSTVGEDGYAYGIPLNFVYEDGAVYFHSALKGHKLDNISFNDKVSFCVIGENRVIPSNLSTRYKSVIVFGKSKELTGEEKRDALKLLVEKYAPAFRSSAFKHIETDFDSTAVFKITIEHMTGKYHK